MCSEHNKPVSVPQNPLPQGLLARMQRNSHTTQRKSTDTHSSDLEKDEKGVEVLAKSPMLDLSHYKMVNEVWHYCSVDWGAKCR